eukprot:c14591_g1_i1.p1 GENE.c14591_g1_i1~~c14591_g1_i1.p1  ORF type:complete len:269 (-),score=88.44 c14591_g1_i1:122-928(-)
MGVRNQEKTQKKQKKMNRLSKANKEKVKQFMALGNCNEKVAIEFLKKADYNLNPAIDQFFASDASAIIVDRKKLEALFSQFKEPNEDKIGVNGLVKFCEQLEVDPSDIIMLIFAWKLKATVMCEFTHSEFIEGMSQIRADSIETLKSRIPSLKSEIDDETTFKSFYNFSFTYSRDPGAKSLGIETATALWSIILVGRWKHLDLWNKFVLEQYKHSISKDTWTMLYDFIRDVGDDLDKYDAEGAWPVVIDEFVQFAKKTKIEEEKVTKD